MKNCKNCANRKGGSTYGKCIVTGYYINTQRKYPTGGCDKISAVGNLDQVSSRALKSSLQDGNHDS